MKKLLILTILGLFAVSSYAQSGQKIVGVWWNDEKSSKIEVSEKDGQFSGTIVFVVPEKYENGEAPKDSNNPDENLQSRSLIGVKILSGLSYDSSKKQWEGGQIYDPVSGKTYDCYAWFEKADDKLFLKGYIGGVKWLGRSTEWTRTVLN